MSPPRWFGLVLLSGLLVVPGLALLGWTRAPAPLPGKRAKGFSNSIGMKLVLIPAGKFTMGSPKDEGDRSGDEQQHEVTITKAFYLAAHEVTQGQWKAVMGKDNNPSYFSKAGAGKDSVKGLSGGPTPGDLPAAAINRDAGRDQAGPTPSNDPSLPRPCLACRCRPGPIPPLDSPVEPPYPGAGRAGT
jgi:formylglycine-generating enzyme required for sulfatase activity